MVRAAWLVVVAAACHRPPPLGPAGSPYDDGHGELAQASIQLLIDEPDAPAPAPDAPGPVREPDHRTVDARAWSYRPPNRTPRHTPRAGLSGVIDGVVRWTGAAPARRATACGPRDEIAIGPDRGVAGALVLIEHVRVGRPLPSDGHPASVGGVIVKRGCALLPALQIVTPLPARLAIHGDGASTALELTPPGAPARELALEPGGHVAVQVSPGLTRVASRDGSLTAAWVLATNTPAYAITDDHGRFRLDQLAPGRYEVTIWHPPLFVDGAYGPPLVIRRAVTVDARRPAHLAIELAR